MVMKRKICEEGPLEQMRRMFTIFGFGPTNEARRIAAAGSDMTRNAGGCASRVAALWGKGVHGESSRSLRFRWFSKGIQRIIRLEEKGVEYDTNGTDFAFSGTRFSLWVGIAHGTS